MRENAGSRPRATKFSQRTVGPELGDVAAVWLLFAVVGTAKLVTYSRIPPDRLYHVTHDGLAGGLSRVLVFANYPTALVAIAVLAVVVDRVGERDATAVGIVAAALCATVVIPGVVDEADLDARLVNAVPALGVAIAVVLTLAALRRKGLRGAAPTRRRDAARIATAAGLTVV